MKESLLTDDPKRTSGEIEIHALEGTDAGALELEGVVGTFEGIRLAVEVEREIGKAGDAFTWQCVLTIPGLGGANPRKRDEYRLFQMYLRKLTGH